MAPPPTSSDTEQTAQKQAHAQGISQSKDFQHVQSETSTAHPDSKPTDQSGQQSGQQPAKKVDPAQGGSASALSARPKASDNSSLLQAKIEQSEMVASTILCHLDWKGEHPEPKAVFKPFSFFCSDSMPSSIQWNTQEYLQTQPSAPATRMARDGSTIKGKAWKVNDQSAANKLEIWVKGLKPGAYLGYDVISIDGQRVPGRFIGGI